MKINENGELVCESDMELCHYGMPRRSGRYPWGSGENPYQGDYPTASAFYNAMNKLEASGMSKTEIAKMLNMSTTDYRAYYAIAKDENRIAKVNAVKSMKTDHPTWSNTQIGIEIGKRFNEDGKPDNESTIRSYLNMDAETRNYAAKKTADILRKQVDEKGMIDVGTMVNRELGVSGEKFDQALIMLQNEGYKVYPVKVQQQNNPGKYTTVKVLCPKGSEYKEAYNFGDIHTVVDYTSHDNGETFTKSFQYPAALPVKRVAVRYPDEGGLERDGMIEIRRGCKDLSLGASDYAQVRILVDDPDHVSPKTGLSQYYIKGMAVYSDGKGWPEGVDVIVNSNKDRATHPTVSSVLKEVKAQDALDGNPFGSNIKEGVGDRGGQSYYEGDDGKMHLSFINKRADEHDWSDWSKELPSQFLSKQPLSTIKKQLATAKSQSDYEFDQIMNVTNPSVRISLMQDFADGCDAAAVELKAAPFANMKYHVIIPGPELGENEIYAPNYPDGSRVALIRYPHAGIFEIPICIVNNHNKAVAERLGKNATDAVAITAKTAGQLSGADFDGDTVQVIPLESTLTEPDGTTKVINPGVNVKNKPQLEGLKDYDKETGKYIGTFDPTMHYGPTEEKEIKKNGKTYYMRGGELYQQINPRYKQLQMGVVSNLITDMTLQGATDDELARAVRHSMVVIDSEKHHLDYKASAYDNGINALRQKYQAHKNDEKYGGASTLISRASSERNILERKEGQYRDAINDHILDIVDEDNRIFKDTVTGKTKHYERGETKTLYVDPKTGEKLYTNTNQYFTKVIRISDDGKKTKFPAYIKVDGKFKRPEYKVVEKDDNLYIKDEDGSFIKVDWAKDKVMTTPKQEKAYWMSLVKDANELSSGTMQEMYYADYANHMKELANKARLQVQFDKGNTIKYSREAKKKYAEEVASLNAKLSVAELNAPKERMANLLASADIDAQMKADPEFAENKEKVRKSRVRKLSEYRAKLGAHRANFDITDKEWEAIMSGAISPTRFEKIYRYANKDRIKELATPRDKQRLSASTVANIKSYIEAGMTPQQIKEAFGYSISSINAVRSGKEKGE